jgi:hypothetical protein
MRRRVAMASGQQMATPLADVSVLPELLKAVAQVAGRLA